MKKFLMSLCFMFWLPWSAIAETAQVMPDLAVEVTLPSERWTLSRQSPSFLVEEVARHLGEEMLKKARRSGLTNAKDVARKMLSANELFIYNKDSGAHLEVDFSPLRAEERPPTRRAVAYSARYAGESLLEEEGLSDVIQKTKKTQVDGARIAYRLDAKFRRHGNQVQFIGVIGFSDPYWFYLYYTDPLKDPRDLSELEKVIRSLRLKRAGE